MNKELLNYALLSVMRDKISVIPVGKDKKPLISWKEFQERHATPEEIQGWFEKFDDPQVGFVTGEISNLTVVDVEEGGDYDWLPWDTTIVKTGGGGYHFYFNYEEGVNNSARIKELTDIRSEGGYVVAPNSVSDKGEYKIINDKPHLPFPKELFPKKQDIFDVPESGVPKFNQNKEIKQYPGYGKGQRNDEMTKYIGHVLALTHPSDWNNQAWPIIDRANKLNTPPLGQKELIATFESVMSIEKRNNPLGRGKSDFYSSGATSREQEEEESISDDDSEVKHIAEVADSQEINQEDIYPLRMDCFDKAILGGVCIGDVITIAGQPGNGKTTLCQSWTMSMLRGEKEAKALWFSYEVLASHLWEKFQEMGMNREDCAFIPSKHSTGDVAWVEKKIKEGKEKFGIKVVFIDHLGFLLPKTKGIMGKNLSSNYSTFLTQIMRDLKTIALKEKVIIFLPVHMRKPDSYKKKSEMEDISGSAGPAQESDLVFLIEREKDQKEESTSVFTDSTKITLSKNRKTGKTVRANFYLEDGMFSFDGSKEKAQKDFDSLGEEEVEESEKKVEEPKEEPQKETTLKQDAEEVWESLNHDK